MVAFVTLIIIIHTTVSFFNLKYGLCSLLIIKILIPDAARSLIPILSLNSLCSIILLSAVFWGILTGKVSKIDFNNKLIKYIYVFFLISLLLLFLTPTPVGYQITPMLNFFVLQIIPPVIAIVIIKSKEDLILIFKVFCLCSFICAVYALSAWLTGNYWYNEWFVNYFGYGRNADLNLTANIVQAGIQGRVIGTASGDSYSYGMIVPILFLIIWILNKKLSWKITSIASVLLIINVLLTVRRTPILTCLSFFFFLFLFSNTKQKIRNIGIVISTILIVWLCIQYIPFLTPFKNILEASIFFWDEDVSAMNDVSGSSVSLREFQFFYTLHQIKDSFLFGNGWGSMYYKSHPSMLGWESIIFTTLMQFGLLGALIFGGLFWQFYKYSIHKSDSKRYQAAYILASLVLCVFTDSLYLAYIFLGCVFMGKFYLLMDYPSTVISNKNEEL